MKCKVFILTETFGETTKQQTIKKLTDERADRTSVAHIVLLPELATSLVVFQSRLKTHQFPYRNPLPSSYSDCAVTFTLVWIQ